MANTDYGAIPLTLATATSQALNHRLGVSTGFKPSEWADNINLLVKPAEKSASGSVAHFTDGLDMPLVSLSCDVTAWQEGSGTASPSNPRAIHGWSEANVTRTGKNLITRPYDSSSGTWQGITWKVESDGKIKGSGTSASATNFQLHANNSTFNLKAGTYTISVIGTMSNARLYVYHSKTATVIKLLTAVGSSSFTLSEDLEGVGIYFNVSSANKVVDVDAYVQLELGSSATDYEAYTGTSLNIPFGQTVYGGRLNATTGELTNSGYKITGTDIGTLYLDSQTETVAVFRFRLDTNNFPEAVANTAISNRFDRSIASGNAGQMVQQANLFYIVVNKSDLASLDKEGIKAWLTSNPTEFVYELATPTTITLTPHQMSSLLGENNIWADCGDSAVVYRGMVGDSFKCFFNSQVTSGWTGTSVERTMLTVTGNGNGSITFDNNGKGRTNCSNSDGYISVRKNGTAVYTKSLAPNTDETLAIPAVNFSAGDVITLVFGFANYHSNINMKLTGDSFTVQGSATVSGISNTTNTSTTLEVST